MTAAPGRARGGTGVGGGPVHPRGRIEAAANAQLHPSAPDRWFAARWVMIPADLRRNAVRGYPDAFYGAVAAAYRRLAAISARPGRAGRCQRRARHHRPALGEGVPAPGPAGPGPARQGRLRAGHPTGRTMTTTPDRPPARGSAGRGTPASPRSSGRSPGRGATCRPAPRSRGCRGWPCAGWPPRRRPGSRPSARARPGRRGGTSSAWWGPPAGPAAARPARRGDVRKNLRTTVPSSTSVRSKSRMAP